jgi:hypothetical protein
VKKSVTGIYRVIVLLLEPEYLLRKSVRLWSTFVDTGSLQLERLAARRVRVSIQGLRTPHPAWCHSVGGSFVGVLRACNAGASRAVHDACSARGAPHCTFEVTWI